MGHEIAVNDTVVSTRREWHRKEHLIEKGLLPREAVKRALPWETELIPVYGKLDGTDDPFPGPAIIDAPGYKMHIRTDDRSVLGIVGKDYKPVPNQVLAEFAQALVEADGTIEVETCGSLRGGKRVFLCAKIGGINVDGQNDILNTYLTITNCHDGTGAFRVYFGTVRVVCMNTFRYAESRSKGAGFWFRHDGDVTTKIEEARKILGLAAKQQETVAKEVHAMWTTELPQNVVNSYFTEVYEATFGKAPEAKELSEKEQQAVGASLLDDALQTEEAKMLAQVNAITGGETNPEETSLVDLMVGEYNDKRNRIVGQWQQNHTMDPAYGTAWGAFNAVTEYHDHQRGRGTPQERPMTDSRMHSNMFGASAIDKQKAHNIALNLVTLRA